MAKKTFEQSLSALEKIVDELESGDLPLEKALKKFDEGMALSRQCSRMLDETEKKVTQLVGETMESTIESPFEIDPHPES
jgi:exodeoxyribonuclease VII small subunit